MYIYHAFINALSAHIIHINLNTMFYTCVEDSPTKTIYIRHYMETHTHTRTHARTHARAHTHCSKKMNKKMGSDISWGENTVRRINFT